MASTNPLPAFSLRHALAWTAFTTLLLALSVSLLGRFVPAAAQSLLVGGAIEIAIYGFGALALIGVKGRLSERFRVLGFASAPVWLLAAGLVLGIAIHGPADLVAAAVDRLAPRSDAELLEAARRLSPLGAPARAALFVLAALVVPLVEETFFRGALFARLRLPGSRYGALVISAVCFVLCHLQPKLWPSLAIVAFALTLLRAVGRGIWPCFLLHASFNATTLVVAFSRAPGAPIERELSLAFGFVATLASLAIILFLLRHVDMERREFT